jgi:hypothetical protein
MAPAVSSADSYIREINIKSEPEALGQKTFMVRFTPSKTAVYDEIILECVYRQELPWEDMKGRKYTKILEPVNFIFRRGSASFVNDLDADVNFKVPMAYDTLSQKFGATTFNKAFPIAVNRILITGIVGGEVVWKLELASSGTFDVTDKTRVPEAVPQTPPAPPQAVPAS